MTDGRGIFERLASLAARPQASIAIALWAVAEAIVLPIVPDVGAALLVIAAPRRAWPLFGAILVGAVVGTLLLASLTASTPEAVDGMLLGIPGVDAAMVAGARDELAREGAPGFAQVGVGTPLKVYTSEWIGLGGDGIGLLAGTLLNRLTRIGPSIVGAALLGWRLRPWIRRHEAVTLGAYAAFWTIVYAIVLG